MRLGARVTLEGFVDALHGRVVEVPDTVYARLQQARDVVDAALAGEAPVYGLNTGLGANLGHRIAAEDIPAFQMQLIAGRAVAVGPLLAAETGRAMLLARLIGAANGVSGMSVPMFDHLCALFRAGLSPGVPAYGSIGASDLTQNACWAMAVLGQGQIWDGTAWQDAAVALAKAGVAPPELQPKDAMALINHAALTVAQSADALRKATQGLRMCQHAAVMSLEGFGANCEIFAPQINALRDSPGQAGMAAWFLEQVQTPATAARVQDALSFRTLAPVMGAAKDAAARAVRVFEDELNGASDSPAVLAEDAMVSTPNFSAPALALGLEQVSLAMAMVAAGAVQRMQRLMNPDLTGLPRYLSPVGGASAGFVPLQKTAAALLSQVRHAAIPIAFDPAPVSDSVEDMAPMTAQSAQKLIEQMVPMHLLAGIEALVAAQARDLRGLPVTPLHRALREHVDMLKGDRPLGSDADKARDCLIEWVG